MLRLKNSLSLLVMKQMYRQSCPGLRTLRYTNMLNKNEYACFAYTRADGGTDIADGIVLELDSESVTIAYDNVIGPATPTQIGLSQITAHL